MLPVPVVLFASAARPIAVLLEPKVLVKCGITGGGVEVACHVVKKC
jgi:hypothetical protein